jgi:putative addiction module component (TIGR02574 family)
VTNTDIEAEALKLPSHERLRLAEVLIASLDVEDEWANAWAAEGDRRYDELRSGAVKGIPADEVFANIRARREIR